MATTAAPRKRGTTKVTPDDFVRIERFLTTQVLVEREQEMRVLIRASIAGVNLHMIASGGLAKSLLLREYARCITNAIYFEKALQPGTPPEAVIGPYDYAAMAQGGAFERKLDGYIGHSHIGFVDELLRSSKLMRDALMPVMNVGERHVEANGGMERAWIDFMVTASNTWFEPDDPYTQALQDRITLMLRVEDIKADDNFKELLRRDHERRQGLQSGAFEKARETMTIEQFELAQAQVAAVRPSPEFLDEVADLRRKVNGEGLQVSPRRWTELVSVCRANAWMSGRDTLVADDLVVVEHGLWREQAQIPTAKKLVQPYRGKFEGMAVDRRAEADKAFARVDAIRPQIEGTPLDEDPPQDVLMEGIKAMREVAAVKQRVEKNLSEAEREQRTADELRALHNEILALEDWANKNGMPVHKL